MARASHVPIHTLPNELLDTIYNEYLDEPSQMAFRMTCKRFRFETYRADQLVLLDQRRLKRDPCYAELVRMHTQSDQTLQVCRMCGLRADRTELFSSCYAQTAEKEAIERDITIRHKCGFHAGPGMVPTTALDICNLCQPRFVAIALLADPSEADWSDIYPAGTRYRASDLKILIKRKEDIPSPWTLQNKSLCLHCKALWPPWRMQCPGCNKKCNICGVRQIQIFARRVDTICVPNRYVIVREDDKFFAVEWHHELMWTFEVLGVAPWPLISRTRRHETDASQGPQNKFTSTNEELVSAISRQLERKS